MATMDYIIYEGAKFLGKVTHRDEKSKPTKRSKNDVNVHGVGVCRVGNTYDIDEWVAKYEGEMFSIVGCKKKVVTKVMDSDPDDTPQKQTEGRKKRTGKE